MDQPSFGRRGDDHAERFHRGLGPVCVSDRRRGLQHRDRRRHDRRHADARRRDPRDRPPRRGRHLHRRHTDRGGDRRGRRLHAFAHDGESEVLDARHRRRAGLCRQNGRANLRSGPGWRLADAAAAIAQAKAAGLPTFVVAPSTTTAAADVGALNALAVAGGYAEPGEIKFDTEATISTLFQTTRDRNQLRLFARPNAAARTGCRHGDVQRRGRAARPLAHARLGLHGHERESIILFGAWCEMVHAARSWQVEVYFGCPNPG